MSSKYLLNIYDKLFLCVLTDSVVQCEQCNFLFALFGVFACSQMMLHLFFSIITVNNSWQMFHVYRNNNIINTFCFYSWFFFLCSWIYTPCHDVMIVFTSVVSWFNVYPFCTDQDFLSCFVVVSSTVFCLFFYFFSRFILKFLCVLFFSCLS